MDYQRHYDRLIIKAQDRIIEGHYETQLGLGRTPWNKGIPMSDDAKKTMGKKNSENLKGRTREDIYGIKGAAQHRELLAAKQVAKLEVTN